MHSLAVQIAPVLAAEKSKVPFYIAGGLLVLWALTVSLGLGLRNERFPGNLQGQRTVSAITAVLVIAAVTTAVITAGGKRDNTASAAQDKYGVPVTPPEPGGTAAPAEAAATTPAATTPAATTPATTTPTATTPATTTPAATKTAATKTAATTTAPAPKGTSLELAANASGQLSYDTKQLSAAAGKVSIAFTNTAPLEHNVTIAQGSTVLGATPTFAGGKRTLTLNLKPGTYTFYCSVPGHRQAGMEGTLTVK
ncbi:MAG TPA: plastocyanin/azurin family copper-binding protein [Solirubrobacteraceae bacterium]|jgi:plastocyanin|nr:plastocyanin/azurin family copper-binding protein [Solirubrobacteraceae bacterium]